LLGGDISMKSAPVSFAVGDKTLVSPSSGSCRIKVDLNSDCRVNLVDFSIAVYWHQRSDPPPNVDFNKDGKIDLVDFSIMTYYWTG